MYRYICIPPLCDAANEQQSIVYGRAANTGGGWE